MCRGMHLDLRDFGSVERSSCAIVAKSPRGSPTSPRSRLLRRDARRPARGNCGAGHRAKRPDPGHDADPLHLGGALALAARLAVVGAQPGDRPDAGADDAAGGDVLPHDAPEQGRARRPGQPAAAGRPPPRAVLGRAAHRLPVAHLLLRRAGAGVPRQRQPGGRGRLRRAPGRGDGVARPAAAADARAGAARGGAALERRGGRRARRRRAARGRRRRRPPGAARRRSSSGSGSSRVEAEGSSSRCPAGTATRSTTRARA